MAQPPANTPIYPEAQTFRRELPRLLAEGHEGKWALINGDDVIDLLETFDEGYRIGRERFLLQPFIVQPVRERQPLIARQRISAGARISDENNSVRTA
jgi:hypothetical protein